MLGWLLREDTHGALLVLGLSLLASACQAGMILLLAAAVAELGAGNLPAPGAGLGFLGLWLAYAPLKQQALVRGVALSETLAGKLGLALAERPGYPGAARRGPPARPGEPRSAPAG